MAITHVASEIHVGNPTTSWVTQLPSGINAGDILVCYCMSGVAVSGVNVSDESDGVAWTKKSAAGSKTGFIYWKRATGNEDNEDCNGTGNSNSCSAAISVFRGCVASGDPFGQFSEQSNASGTELHSGITTTQAGEWVGFAVNRQNSSIGSTVAATSPATLPKLDDTFSTGGNDTIISTFGAIKSAAGATGDVTWSMTNQVSYSILFSLLPAGTSTSMAADAGSYSITGAATVATTTTPAAAASYSQTGTAMVPQTSVPMGSSSYTYTGFDVTFIEPEQEESIDAEAGTYSQTGAAALASVLSPAAAGSYSQTGTAIDFVLTRAVIAGTGGYTYTGEAAVASLIVPFASSSYTIIGTNEMDGAGLAQGAATAEAVALQIQLAVGTSAGVGSADGISAGGVGSGSRTYVSRLFFKDVQVPNLKFHTSDVDKVYFGDTLVFRKNLDSSAAGLSAGVATAIASPPLENQSHDSILTFARFLATLAPRAPSAGTTLTINSVSLGSFDLVVKDGPVTLSSFSNADWFTNTEDSRSAAIVVKGNLTIDASRILIPDKRKLFTLVYVTGNLIVNGSISMTGRGANHSASGSNIAAGAIRIAVGTFSGVTNPTVPAAGGSGGPGGASSSAAQLSGNSGGAAPAGGTGGGGGGGLSRSSDSGTAISGSGTAGTSFCGGPGGGGILKFDSGFLQADNGDASGGRGGNAESLTSGPGEAGCASGGAGNPGGTTESSGSGSGQNGEDGCGGTLIVIVEGEISGGGTIEAKGKNTGLIVSPLSSVTSVEGGGSGGGSIHVLADSYALTSPSLNAAGGSGNQTSPSVNGGDGGVGSTRALVL